MLSAARLAALVRMVVESESTDAVLDELTKAALQLTFSRNAMLARVNEEEGTLHLRHGAGADWSATTSAEQIHITDRVAEGIVAYVAATGQAIVSGDVRAEPRYRKLFGSSLSEMAIPSKDRHGRIRAVLNLESDVENRYDAEARYTAEIIAGLAALAIEREDMAKRERALVLVGAGLEVELNDEELIARVMQVVQEVLRLQACSLFLFDPAMGKFMLRGSVGPLQSRVGEVGYDIGEGFTGWVGQTSQPLRVDHPQKDPRWIGKYFEFPGDEIASYLAVPVVVRGKCIGVLRAVRKKSPNPYLFNSFTDDDERLLKTIADQLAAGLENIRSVERTMKTMQMAAWGELSAKSSHMIGNRVFALKGDVNELDHLLRSCPVDVHALRALQQSLWTNVTRIEEILQDFRDFVTATQLSLVRADINFVVQESVREVFPKRSKVQLVFDLAPSLPEVELDTRRIRRALSELVENSLSFFDEGKLVVRTRMARRAEVLRAKLPSSRNYVAIIVEDEGPGIKREDKVKVFQPFYSSRVKGMGLGLSIVKGIFDAHGGTVFESGTEGKGARFVLLLPASESEPPKSVESKKR